MDVIPIATVMIRAVSWVIHGAGTCLGAFVHILSRHLGGDVMNPLQKQLRVGIVPGHTVRRTLAPRLTSGGRSPKFKLPAESRSISQSLSGGRAIPSGSLPSLAWTLIHAAHSASVPAVCLALCQAV